MGQEQDMISALRVRWETVPVIDRSICETGLKYYTSFIEKREDLGFWHFHLDTSFHQCNFSLAPNSQSFIINQAPWVKYRILVRTKKTQASTIAFENCLQTCKHDVTSQKRPITHRMLCHAMVGTHFNFTVNSELVTEHFTQLKNSPQTQSDGQ